VDCKAGFCEATILVLRGFLNTTFLHNERTVAGTCVTRDSLLTL